MMPQMIIHECRDKKVTVIVTVVPSQFECNIIFLARRFQQTWVEFLGEKLIG